MNESSSNLERLKIRREGFRAWGRKFLPFASGLSVALLAVLLYYSFVIKPTQLTEGQVNDAVAMALGSATPPAAFSAQVYQVIQPSLVLIQTKGPGGSGGSDFGLGSGVVVDQVGDILTSLHVVANAGEIEVTFADGTKANARVISEQPENDIAVLQVDQLPDVLVPAILGNPGAMQVGDEAFVVGNPFGLYSSMSAGVISGFNRSFRPPEGEFELQGMIQIDAAVNPGNSGGPLLNRSGHVIGIVTGIVNPTEENFFVGIGFAVPINIAVGGGGGSPPY